MSLRIAAAVWVFLVMSSPALLEAQAGYSRARRGSTRGSGASVPQAYKDVAGSFHGKLKELSDKEIMIVNDDNQMISVRRSHKTKFLKDGQAIKPSEIDLETPVTVDATEDSDLKLTAVNVTVDSPRRSVENK
ncbi:MAG TPA: hypothetical protein VMH80_25365 [Bryobacteraceae bacterium]|nr:hypothetical protein [Bryobacteraceae bacterium]